MDRNELIKKLQKLNVDIFVKESITAQKITTIISLLEERIELKKGDIHNGMYVWFVIDGRYDLIYNQIKKMLELE